MALSCSKQYRMSRMPLIAVLVASIVGCASTVESLQTSMVQRTACSPLSQQAQTQNETGQQQRKDQCNQYGRTATTLLQLR